MLPADVLERWPHVCRVKITFTLLTKLLRFHNNKCDETHCKLKSIENQRLFEKYPAPPYPSPENMCRSIFFPKNNSFSFFSLFPPFFFLHSCRCAFQGFFGATVLRSPALLFRGCSFTKDCRRYFWSLRRGMVAHVRSEIGRDLKPDVQSKIGRPISNRMSDFEEQRHEEDTSKNPDRPKKPVRKGNPSARGDVARSAPPLCTQYMYT